MAGTNIFDDLLSKVRSIDWAAESTGILNKLREVCVKSGRVVAGQLLSLYYVLNEGDLSSSDKFLIYAALIYVIVPGDLIPRKIFGLLGIADDLGAVYYVWQKVQKKMTPHIRQKVEIKLDEWFGYEIV